MLFLSASKGNSLSAAERGETGVVGVVARGKVVAEGRKMGLAAAAEAEVGVPLFKLLLF